MITPRPMVCICALLCASSVWASRPATAQHADGKPASAQPVADPGQIASPSAEPNRTRPVIGALEDDSEQLILTLPHAPANAPYEAIKLDSDLASNERTLNSFDLKPESQLVPRPSIDPIALFDSAYGMHGFMRHRWVTQQFGLSAGLGLKLDQPSRQVLEDFDLADMAESLLFGMGFLFAF